MKESQSKKLKCTAEFADDLYRSLGDALESCEDEIPAKKCPSTIRKPVNVAAGPKERRVSSNRERADDKNNGKELTEQDLGDLYRSLGDALESRSPREDVQIRRRPKNPRFTIKMPVNEAAGTVKRLVGSNGAPSIFYLTEFNGDSVAEQPALPPPPPPHPVMRLKLKAVGSKENIRPSTTPAQKHRKIVMKESQSKKLKCTAEFFAQFLASWWWYFSFVVQLRCIVNSFDLINKWKNDLCVLFWMYVLV